MTTATRTLDLHYSRPYLYPKQEAAVFDPARYSHIEASTKSGKTVGCICWLIEQALHGLDGQNFWWIAPIYAQTKIAFRRAKRSIPRQIYTSNEAELTIALFNGTVITFKSAEKPDSLFGEDVYAAVIDEATRCKEEAWFAIRSTLTATRGPVRIIGNVKGRRNWAYKLARKAESGEADSAYHRITAQDAVDAGILTSEEIEDARLHLPDSVAQELFDAIAADDHGNPFGIDHIRDCIGPLSDHDPIIWGWDLARKVDWCVGIGLDHQGKTCRFERFQMSWEDTIKTIVERTKGVKAVVDASGVGDPIVERLQRAGLEVDPVIWSAPMKQQHMEGLAVAIQSHDITYPEGVISLELETFEYEYTRTGVRYTAPPGMWDDCVSALALAVSGVRFGALELWVPDPEYKTEIDNLPGVSTLDVF